MSAITLKRGDTINFTVNIETSGVNLDVYDVAGMIRKIPISVKDRGEKLADFIISPVAGVNNQFTARCNPIDTNRFPVGTDSVAFDFEFTNKSDATEVISTESIIVTVLEDQTYVN